MTELITVHRADLVAGPITPDWGQAAADWAKNLKSDRTRRAYLEAWADFLGFVELPPDQVSQSEVIEYRAFLKTAVSQKTGRPFSQSTINQRLSAISAFYTFAQGRGLRADNPVEGVARETVSPYGRASWLDVEAGEDLRLLSVIDGSTPQGLRDRAIMLIFLTLGLRVESVARLRVGDLRRQGEAAFLTVTAKRGKTADKRLPSETFKAVDAYLQARPDLSPASPLFTATERGRAAARRLAVVRGFDVGDESPLTTRQIANLVKTYCNKAFGPGHGIHPHSLRHTAAKAAEVEGFAVTDISDLLGHGSINTTTIYMHATARAGDKVAARLGRRYADR